MNNMNEKQIEELVLLQAKLYLGGGKSLREIAALTGQSHVTVKRNFDVRLKDISLTIYLKVQEKLADNKEDTVEDEKVSERVLLAYDLLVNQDKKVIEIAEELGTTEFIIYRDLTKRLSMIHQISPQLVSKEMLKNVELTFKRHSNENAHSTKNKK